MHLCSNMGGFHCLCTKMDEDGIPIILVLYVDDIQLSGKKKSTLNALKQQVNSAFSMKDLGEAEHILRMRIKKERHQYTLDLSHEKYIEKVPVSLLECPFSHMLGFPRMIISKMMMQPIT